jgi:hypothetical protein
MAAKIGVLVVSGTSRASVMLSVMSVPKTLMTTTTDQYAVGTYLRSRNCTNSSTTSSAPATYVVFVRPKLRLTLR